MNLADFFILKHAPALKNDLKSVHKTNLAEDEKGLQFIQEILEKAELELSYVWHSNDADVMCLSLHVKGKSGLIVGGLKSNVPTKISIYNFVIQINRATGKVGVTAGPPSWRTVWLDRPTAEQINDTVSRFTQGR